MNLSRIYAIFIRQIFLIKSNPIRLVNIFLWIIIDMLQWGFITRYLDTFGGATFSFITVILGAVVLWEFMIRIQQGVLVAFLEDIWSRNFVNFFASPLKVREYAAGLILTSIVTSLVASLAMVLIVGLIFGYNIFTLGLLLLPFVLILFVLGITLGFFSAAVVFRFGSSAEWISWPVPFMLSIFSGVFFPISALPNILQSIAKLLPPAYVFESMRAILTSTTIPNGLLPNLLLGGGLALIYLALMFFFFVKVCRRNLRTGNIAKFSAEEF